MIAAIHCQALRLYLKGVPVVPRRVANGEGETSLARVTRLGLYHAEQIGTHYARTLRAWRERFHRPIDAVRAQGFDDRFIRMWDVYLGYCEAAFHDRHIGDVQLLLSKAANRRVLPGEPWNDHIEASPAEALAKGVAADA